MTGIANVVVGGEIDGVEEGEGDEWWCHALVEGFCSFGLEYGLKGLQHCDLS